jgi:predicted nucleic acid-binding protein
VSVYLDTNVLVALFVKDTFNAEATAFFRDCHELPVVSDFAEAEFAAVVARRVRAAALTAQEGQRAFVHFDRWKQLVLRSAISTADITAATNLLRRLDTGLLPAEAIHIVVAQRLSAALLTFDQTMAANAERLGVTLASV